ncbi:MAG: RsmE family RNA methyltransferase [Fuerstiella sp.]
MADRFYCRNLSEPTALLSESEAHHAIHVMRVKPGAQLELFNGAGTAATARVRDIRRNAVELEICSRSVVEKPDHGLLSLAAVPPKGERLKWMVEKLTELGVDEFIPLRCRRAVVDPRPARLEKLSATVVSASKQCGRNWLMQIADPMDLPDLLASAADLKRTTLMAHPGSYPTLNEALATPSPHCLVVIGPEGGFTDDEVMLAEKAGVGLFSRAGSILRAETAAIAFAAIAMAVRSGQMSERC